MRSLLVFLALSMVAAVGLVAGPGVLRADEREHEGPLLLGECKGEHCLSRVMALARQIEKGRLSDEAIDRRVGDLGILLLRLAQASEHERKGWKRLARAFRALAKISRDEPQAEALRRLAEAAERGEIPDFDVSDPEPASPS